MTPAGLEPAIPGSVGRCLIHWATGPLALQQQGEQEWRERERESAAKLGKSKYDSCGI